MDIEKEREAFEKQGNIRIFVKQCLFDEQLNEYSSKSLHDYTLGFVNGAWWAWQAKAQAVPKWVSVEDRLPPCDFEFCETGEQVSSVVLIHSAATYGFNMGMGHVNEDGVWNAYSGEHDFMNVLNVTHWMPLPDAPQEPAK